ncbi:MAG TPA: sigma-70 family RNA polymerase sigma factor, partial [Planctomycetota bacterium]
MTDLPDVSVDALRRVARGILFDRHGAEDVVQEAWLAELRANPPVASRAGWLTVVVRNLALNRRREEARRGRRERAVARPEAQGDPAESLAHIEVLRRLLDALERLDEPYRNAVALRYLEEEPPRAIAKRLGLPVNTVRTHVRRGLERLRRDLDGERGEDRQASLAALVPFAGGIPWTAGLGTGGAVLMQKKLALAGLVALLLGAAYFVLRPGRAALRSATAPVELAAAPATVPAPREEPRPSLAPARAAVEGQRESAAQPMTVTGAWVVRGHAFRKLGQSFPGLALRGRVYAGTKTEGIPLLEARFAADENGDFAWPLEPPSELVTVQVAPEPTGHVPMSAWEVFLPGDPAPERFVVRAMPLDCTVRGRVLDPERRPVSGAHVRERDRIEEQETTTDAEGRYALHIPADSERRLRIHAPGLAQTTITVNAAEPGEVQAPDVVLQPELRVRGVVRDEEGQPVADALVKPAHPFRWVSATTGADGAFELGTLDREAQYLALEAHREGYVSASKRLDGEERDAPVELVLARGTRVVGRVSAPDGAPVWGAWISIGYNPWSEPRIEAWSDREGRFELAQVPLGAQTLWAWRTGFAQQRTPVEIRRGAAPHQLDLVLEESHFVGGIVQDEAGEPLPWTMVYVEGRQQAYDTIEVFQSYTGPDGRFHFEGLPDVPLLVGALSQGRARAEVEVPGPDRDDVVVRLVRAAGFAGTVVDAATGTPVREFAVRVGFPAPEHAEEAVSSYPASWSHGVSFVDPEGRWSLHDDFAPGQYAAITIVAAGYAPAAFEAVRTELAPDPAAFVARLSAGTLVRGRVVQKGTGEPLAGARIRRVTATRPYESL